MTNATREEVLQSLLCCHADLCRMEGRTKDREHDIVASVSRAVSRALLDLAAPETEEEKPKAEEKHPGVIAKPGKDGEIEWCWCQKCYAQAAVVHDPFGDGENWSYCQKCGVSFRLKLGEGEK